MFKFKKKFTESIQFKFLSVMFVIMVITAFAASAFIAQNERKMLKQSLFDKGQSLGSYLAKLSKDPLIMKDYIQLDAIVKDITKDPEVAYATVQDTDGKVLTSLYASVNYQVPGLKAATATVPKDGDLAEVIAAIKKAGIAVDNTVPIAIEGDVLGNIAMGMSDHKIIRQIYTTVLYILAVNLIVAFLLGAALYASSKKIILGPIAKLTDLSRRIAQGEIFQKIEISSHDEIGKLMESFGDMSGYLKNIGETAGEISQGELRREVTRRSEHDYLGDSFQKMMSGLQNIVSRVRQNSQEISAASGQLASMAEEGSKNNESAAAAIEEITATMHEMAANTTSVAKNTISQAASVNETSSSIEQMIVSIKRVAENVKRLVDI